MSRQKLELIQIPFQLGLNTETHTGMLLQDGQHTTLSNLRPENGALVRRSADAKIGADLAATHIPTGLICESFAGYNMIIRMYTGSGGVIESYNYPGGSWATVASGLNNNDTNRWNYTRWLQAPLGVTPAEKLVFTDYLDEILVWGGTGSAVTLSTLSSSTLRPKYARDVAMFGGRLCAFNIIQVDGATTYPNRMRWSDIYDYTTWNDNDWEDLTPRGSDGIQCAYILNSSMYIFYKDTVHRVVSTADTKYPFSFEYDILPVGCTDIRSIIEYKNMLIFKASDNTIRAFDGYKSYILSSDIKTLLSTYQESTACLDTLNGNYLLKQPNVNGGMIVLNFGTVESATVDSIIYHLENHPGSARYFLANSPTGCFVFTEAGVGVCYTAHLYDSLTGQDFGTTDVTFSDVGKEYFIGDNQEAFIEEIIVFGTGTITASLTLNPSGNIISGGMALSATGTSLNVGQWANSFKLSYTQPATPATTTKIYKVIMRIHNRRLQQGV